MLRFNPATHRYHNIETGRFVSRSEVLGLVDKEVLRLETRLKGHARLLAGGKIEISEFQIRMAESLKDSHIRMATLGAGGEKAMNSQQYGHVGQGLKQQYKFLYQFGKDLESGSLSEKRILSRASQYAQSANTAFHKSEFVARGKQGFYAKRLLDPQSRHCAECVGYQQLQWTLVNLVVPPGVNCSCGGRCRCRLIFQKV
jgi:hypothetical protein